MLRLVVLALCLTFSYAGAPSISDCARQYKPANPKLSNIVMTVSDCDNPDKCYLIRNTTHHVTFEFTPDEDFQGLAMKVFGNVMRVRVPYVRNVDLCPNTASTEGTPCEGAENGLKAGKRYLAHYDFYIRSRFPEWEVPVEFELHSPTEILSCSQVQVKIQCNPASERTCVAPVAPAAVVASTR